ncbi:CPBP family intramembrane metalloprotease [Pseudonocardia ailaonensis]|uniref:CPBP family intramembrane metalloprotease n=1 Tax=Pseudonocardia ailaonensis TaxID=367279 RepID=A0ABN2N2V3_9PSEU
MDAHEHAAPPPAPADDRLGRLVERRDGADFPFYDGTPVGLSAGRWTTVCVACLVAFLVLSFVPAPNDLLALVPRILFTGIMLGALGWATGPCWRAIFRRVGIRDVGLMVLFAALNYVVTVLVALLVSSLFTTSANSAVGAPTGGVAGTVARYLGTAIQLLGEELLTVLPLLALLHVLTVRAGLSRRTAILLSWLVTAVWFGLLHLPTYDGNLAQALLVIGVARLVLTLAYLRTKNLWVSTGAHILNDWTLLTIGTGTAALLV